MKTIFADSFYWVALFHPRDTWHSRAVELSRAMHPFQIVTTEEVLTEFLNFACSARATIRKAAVEYVRELQADSDVEIVAQSHESFTAGLDLYFRRLDKAYSLADCISMTTMYSHGLSEVLTQDRADDQ